MIAFMNYQSADPAKDKVQKMFQTIASQYLPSI